MPPETNLRGLKIALNKLPWLMLSLFAEAEPTANAINSAAQAPASMSLLRVCICELPLRGALDRAHVVPGLGSLTCTGHAGSRWH